MQADSALAGGGIREILPKAGLVYSEKGNLGEVLSKPKIMPIKVRCAHTTSSGNTAALVRICVCPVCRALPWKSWSNWSAMQRATRLLNLEGGFNAAQKHLWPL